MKEKKIEEVFSQFLEEKIIVRLNEFEKERYIAFFEDTYKDNLNTAKYNLKEHPRWSIIAGYYAMHDITKLFLAKNYNLKIVNRVHFAAIIALSNVLKQDEEKLKLTKLLKEARELFDENILGKSKKNRGFLDEENSKNFLAKPENIVAYLKKGKSERGKIQYYNPRIEGNISEKAGYFIDKIVIPFVEIIKKLNNSQN
jgi:hypothetical protein